MKSILLVAGAGLATAVSAANVSWTGKAGDGQWGTAGNWSTGTVPTSADVALFAKAKLASGAVVKLGADRTRAGFTDAFARPEYSLWPLFSRVKNNIIYADCLG